MLPRKMSSAIRVASFPPGRKEDPMLIRGSFLLAFLLIVGACEGTAGLASDAGGDYKLLLKEGWSIQSSNRVTAKGETLSTLQYLPQGWYRTSVPTTVLNALIENKVYPD